jgi:TPR repeat protein
MSNYSKILVLASIAVSLLAWRIDATQAQTTGYNPNYYQRVNPTPSQGPPCGHIGTAPCPVQTTNAPQNMSAEQLLAYADKQVKQHDYAGAMSTYQRAAAMGNIEAKRQVAVGHVRGIGVRQDAQKGIAMLEDIAKNGDAKAYYHLGYFFENGKFVQRDYARALQDLRAASKGGVWFASFKLGVMYELGEGTPHDRAAAISWFDRAASQRGDASAAYYADFLRSAGSQRFNSGDAMASAYWAWFMKRYESLLPKSSGNGTGNFNQRCNAIPSCANAVWPRN